MRFRVSRNILRFLTFRVPRGPGPHDPEPGPKNRDPHRTRKIGTRTPKFPGPGQPWSIILKFSNWISPIHQNLCFFYHSIQTSILIKYFYLTENLPCFRKISHIWKKSEDFSLTSTIVFGNCWTSTSQSAWQRFYRIDEFLLQEIKIFWPKQTAMHLLYWKNADGKNSRIWMEIGSVLSTRSLQKINKRKFKSTAG